MRQYGHTLSSAFGAFIVDGRGTILGFDEAMESLTGWPAYEVVGRHKNLACSSGNGPRSRPLIATPLFDGSIDMAPESRNIEMTLHCRDGKILEVEAEAKPLSGAGDRIQVTLLRVMASSPARRMRHARDRRDDLTGLQDPEAFAARLENEFDVATRTAQPLGLVLADVDRLREINDRLGHEAGDEVLRKLAGVLRVSVDDDGRLCRLGEDDFAILLPRAGRGDARQLAAGLRSTVERYRFFAQGDVGEETHITLSLGAASFPADADSAVDLMERAREALDEARAMGRNRVWCYLRKPRVPLEVPVYFDTAESSLVGYARDLSPSGLFVQTSVTIDIGMRCALTFPLPGLGRKVHVIGRVVRTVPPEVSEDSQGVRVPGMGVEFEQFGGPSDRRSIDAYLHEHEAETLRPENGVLSVGPD